jgi:hypothetical protein
VVFVAKIHHIAQAKIRIKDSNMPSKIAAMYKILNLNKTKSYGEHFEKISSSLKCNTIQKSINK